MRFDALPALSLLPAVAAIAVLTWMSFRWREAALRRFAKGEPLATLTQSVGRGRQRLRAALVVTALALLVVGLARPYLDESSRSRPPRQADILLVLDVSLSMAAQDARPSRLEAAKNQAIALIDRLQGDRVGLVVFAGTPALRFPLTHDYGAAKGLLRSVEPDSAPVPGSALAAGVRSAVRALRQSDAPLRTVYVVSDGEDLGGALQEAAAEAEAAGIAVSTLGVGTLQGGTIPVRGPGGTVAPKRDRSGQVVVTRLDPGPLGELASHTGGRYALATEGGRELLSLYSRTQSQLATRDLDDNLRPNDLGTWFLLAGLALLLAEMIISERVTRREVPGVRFAGLPLALLLAGVSCVSEESPVFRLNEEGARLFKSGDFPAALERFRHAQVQRPDLPQLTFNAGGALYKTQEYDRSIQETQRALDGSDTQIRSRAHFNMGNAYFQKQQFQDAVESYKKSLKENPSDLEAKINLELTLRRLEAIRQQQQAPQGNPGQPGQDPQNPPQPEPGQPGQPPDGNPPGEPGQPQPGQDPRAGGPSDAVQELRRALQDAGQEVDIEEALRILDALRQREQQFQDRLNRQQPGRGNTQRPDKDW